MLLLTRPLLDSASHLVLRLAGRAATEVGSIDVEYCIRLTFQVGRPSRPP
jgi:hypothetical protein